LKIPFEPRSGDEKVAGRETSGLVESNVSALKARQAVLAHLQCAMSFHHLPEVSPLATFLMRFQRNSRNFQTAS